MTDTFSIEHELAKLPEEAQPYVKQRLEELDVCLQQTSHYCLRDDSRLAFRFATDQLPGWSHWTVAHEMACQQFLCDTVPYQDTLQPFLKFLATQLKVDSGVDWKPVWKAVAELGPEILKLHLMCEKNVIMPDFYPPEL